MTPDEFYEKLQCIPPNLAEHQKHVAAVAWMVADSSPRPYNTERIVAAALIHDLGNLIKYVHLDKLEANSWLRAEDIPVWKKKRAALRERFGNNVDMATLTLAKEMRVSSEVIKTVPLGPFTEESIFHETPEALVVHYGDLRVSPSGITSIVKRNEDARRRYRTHPDHLFSEKDFDRLEKFGKALEEYLFSDSSLTPEDISDSTITPYMLRLSSFHVPCAV